MTADYRLRRQTAALRGLELVSFRSRSRFAFYNYLGAVHEEYARLAKAKRSMRRITTFLDIPIIKNSQPSRVIIDATSDADG